MARRGTHFQLLHSDGKDLITVSDSTTGLFDFRTGLDSTMAASFAHILKRLRRVKLCSGGERNQCDSPPSLLDSTYD